MRLALQTSAETTVEFMRSGWQLPTPDLIISVTGGGRQCKISAHLRKTFQRGLVAAAAATSERRMWSPSLVTSCSRSTDAWLITSGTNTGIVKEVGQALNNYRYKSHKHGLEVPCIGIGNWQCTAGREQLEIAMTTSTRPGSTRTPGLSRIVHQHPIESLQMVGLNVR